MRNADRLVSNLGKLGFTVYGASFHILHFKDQEYLNRQAGECAPTWELLVEPLWYLGKVVKNGRTPTVGLPDGKKLTMTVYSYMPLSHILKTPTDEWDVWIDDANRLLVCTKELPNTWK